MLDQRQHTQMTTAQVLNFPLFGTLKAFLERERFGDQKDFQNKALKYFKQFDKQHYHEGIQTSIILG